MEWLLSWEVTSVISVGLASFAFAFISLDDSRLAKVFLLLAATDALGGTLMWGIKSSLPTWATMLIVFCGTGALAVLLVSSLRYVDHKRESKYGAQSGSATSRAHLHVTRWDFTAPADEGGTATVKVTFVNDGDIAARVLSAGHMGFFLIDPNPQVRMDFEESLFANVPKVDLVANDEDAFDVPVKTDRSITITSSPWAKKAIDEFIADRANLYVAGKLFYSDVNSQHETTYCAYVNKDGKLHFCHKHNEEP